MMDAMALMVDAGAFGLLALLVYSILRSVAKGKGNRAEPALSTFVVPVEAPPQRPKKPEVRPVKARKPSGLLGRVIRLTSEPWIVFCSFLWLACLPLAASGLPESIEGSMVIAPNALMAWILTGLMTLVLGVSLLSGVVSEEYDSLPSEAGGVTSASAWEEIEP